MQTPAPRRAWESVAHPPTNGFRPGRLALGLGVFAVLTALGLLTAGWFDRGASTVVSVTRAIPAGVVAGVLALVLLDFLLGGLRLHLWVRRLQPEVGYTASLRAYLVNLFAAAILPMAAASAPAQLATLVRAGMRPARAVAALLLNYVGILSALLLVGGLGGLYLLTISAVGAKLGGLERALLLGSATSATLLVIVILNPRAGGAVAAGTTYVGLRLGGRVGRLLRSLGSKLEHGVAEYRAAIRIARADWQIPLAGGVGLSGAMLLNKCAVGFLVVLGLGLSAGYVEVTARLALQLLFLYFSPSPGGSGLAEATVPAFMAGVVPEGQWMEFALLWRVGSSYLGVAVGAIAVATVFGRRSSAPAVGAGAPSTPGPS